VVSYLPDRQFKTGYLNPEVIVFTAVSGGTYLFSNVCNSGVVLTVSTTGTGLSYLSQSAPGNTGSYITTGSVVLTSGETLTISSTNGGTYAAQFWN
jgi:hypothetical protein